MRQLTPWITVEVESFSQRVVHEVLEPIISTIVRLPNFIRVQDRTRIAEQQTQEHLGNNATSDWSQSGRVYDHIFFFHRNHHRLLEVHSFGKNISPQRTIILECASG